MKVTPLEQATQGNYTITFLRGFERVSLNPGETKQVTFELTPEDLQLLDRNMRWTVEPGEFEFMIGASSKDIKLRKTVKAL